MNLAHGYIPHRLWYFNYEPGESDLCLSSCDGREIEDAVKDGAASFKEVKKLTKAGKSCGKCKKKVKKFMEAILEEQNIENPECVCAEPGRDAERRRSR